MIQAPDRPRRQPHGTVARAATGRLDLTAAAPPHRRGATSPPRRHLTAAPPPHRRAATSPPRRHLTAAP
ncbi:hypothetical protein OHA72_54560 [Dactylosporangium sp. NBC_01737]|uniref:hypothetical protein n=1 Tax=Dactylosporangium sp. NBC_01737 TaxID=2975959 RepID=UPI002E10E55F|nr:hypothetical protein OHA72_54560 [Dactylosporangium sp. NBC_01737]